MRKISIAIPTYNRFEMTIRSFAQVLDDERVESVTISDDASTDGSFEKLCDYFHDSDKIILYSNLTNMDCYFNKHEAMLESKSEFCILLDSDNIIDNSYLDAIYAIPEWDEKAIYQPSFAKPHFDFRKWSGLTLTKENVAQYADTHLMTSLNACNHFINREEYLKVWDGNTNPGSSDSIYFCFCWLKSGGKIYISPNLEYDHHIAKDNSGHYQKNSARTVGFHNELMKKIRQLS